MNAPIRKTKIVCTMGPNLFEKHLIAPLMKAGMNVARFNFSHGTYETHQHYYDEVCRIRDELGLPVATMLDTKGPEIRVRSFKMGASRCKTASCSPSRLTRWRATKSACPSPTRNCRRTLLSAAAF